MLLETAMRVCEIIGLTWSDIDMKNKQVSITHRLIYKNLGEGAGFVSQHPKPKLA